MQLLHTFRKKQLDKYTFPSPLNIPKYVECYSQAQNDTTSYLLATCVMHNVLTAGIFPSAVFASKENESFNET